jgi:hypothetical protein
MQTQREIERETETRRRVAQIERQREATGSQPCRLGLQQYWAYPGQIRNGIKTGLSRSNTVYRKYGRKSVHPFSVPLPFPSIPFSVLFPFIPEETKTDWKIWYTVADETGFIPSVFNFNFFKRLNVSA